MSKLRSNEPCEEKMTRKLSKNLGAVSKELQTSLSHTDSIEGRSTAVESTKESKSSYESEKKRLSSTSRNKPPELVPYCDDVHISDPNEDNSSPPHLFPEGIMTRTKLNKSLPGKTVKDIQVIDIGSSPPRKQDEVECIELDDSSEFECDEEYVIAAKLKRKVHPLCKSAAFSSMKQGKWRDPVETDYEYKGNEKSASNFFINMKIGKTRLKERDKLRKASERMRRSPRALMPKAENTNICSSSVHERHCGDDVNTTGTETFRNNTDGGNVTKCSASSNLLDREWNRTFSQKTNCTLRKGVNFSPLHQIREGAKLNITECIDVIGESIGSFESKDVEAKPVILGGYVRNEVASSEAALKQQCTETNSTHRESRFSLSLKNVCTELLHNHLACDVKNMKEETKWVAEKMCNKSKVAVQDSDASVHNEYSKAQDHVPECVKSGSDSDSSEVPGLKGVDDKLKIVSTELTRFTGLHHKQFPGIKSCVVSGKVQKECNMIGNAEKSTVRHSNKGNDFSSSYCKENFKMCETKRYCSDEMASYMSNEDLKKDETVIQTHSAEFAKCDCDSTESKSLGMKKNKENKKLIRDVSFHEGHRKVDCQKCSLGSAEAKVKKYETIKREISDISESNFKTYPDTTKNDKEETSCVMVPGTSSDSIFPEFLGKSNFNGTSKLNNSHISEKSVSCQSHVSSARMIVDSFGRDLLAGCDIAQGSPDNTGPNTYVTLGSDNWPVVEGDEDEDDYVFTLPQRVSTGKEERDIIDGIEMLSFETEHDMVEFTKIQQDFCHGSSVDDGMIQSDDGLDMMDDSFAHSGDVDLQYVHQAIVPTKTNDITKIKGWRNKQFAVNDNPSHYFGFSNEAFEEDDGFESCDVKIMDETNMEEDQQNHWYSEDAKHNDMDLVGTSIKDEDSQVTEERTSNGNSGKQKTNPVKDDVMLSSGDVFRPQAVELLKHLQTSISETKNSRSAFISDILDNYLSTHSQLNVSYEIPKLGAEEGITHHSEYETDQFIFPSPPKLSLTVSEKPSVPRKPGSKPKTLAEKRKMLEQEMLEVEYIKGHKRIPHWGRPRLHPQTEPVTSRKFPKHFESKMPVTQKLTSSVPEKEELEQKAFTLDPDYKYTWIGKRPIRITGSKLNREPTVNEHTLSCNVQPEIKQDPTHVSVASEVTSSHNEVSTDTKLSYETREQNSNADNLTACNDLQPSQSDDSTDPSEYGVVVFPGVGHPLHPFAIKELMFLRSSEVYIDKKWAEFAVAVVTSRKDVSNHSQTQKHVICIRHTHPFQNLNFKTSPHKTDKVPPLEPENTSLITEVPRDCDSIFSSFRITRLSPNPEISEPNLSLINADSSVGSIKRDLESVSVGPNNSKADENLSSDPSFVPPDKVLIEVKSMLKEMIDCILNHEIENTVIQDDPDASCSVTVITPKCPKKVVSKYMKNKVYRELNRLDVNVIVMGEDRNDYMEKINGGSFCEQDFCRLGCVCASLQACQPSAALTDHCGNAECMFECCCQESSTNQSSSNFAEEKPSLLYCTAMRLQDEGNRHLAKVEKEFRHTVIQSKNKVIVIGGGSSGDGGRRRREIKLPERYRDSSVVLGKEFAMTEFKMITGEDINITSAVSSNTNSRRCERQLYLPNYVEVGVPKSPSVSITKPLHKPTRGKLTIDQKIPLWCERFKVKPCKVDIERMKGLEDVVPWCMLHLRYDCFCSGKSSKPFKRMPCGPVERPPPVPGPPLDCAGMKVDTVKEHASRNVAVKSTSHSTSIHTHNVDCHSARTYGTTINYVLRNQSHFFRRRHKRIHLQDSETMRNVIDTQYSPFLITQPVDRISKIDMAPGDFVIQSAPFLLNEQEVMPTNSDLGEDNEEVGFGKIVSIMSLKPEEFEKCGSMDQSQHGDDGACNMDMFVNPKGKLTEVLSDETSISEENSHLIQTKMETHSLHKQQDCFSEEKSLESEISEKLPSALIPILPEGSSDVNSVRLAELISKKDSELRNVLENCIMPLDLSQTTTGSVQLISWKILLNQVESKIYHLWLQYKRGSVPKLIVTGTADKPDQYCISLHDSYPHSPPDFHNKLPPFITFLIEQLCNRSKIPHINSGGINCFGLLQFDGNNWELVGSLQRNVREVEEWYSNQPAQIQTTEQADYQEISERQQQDQISVEPSQQESSGDIAEKKSCIMGKQEVRKEAKFNEESENKKMNMKAVASDSPPYKNLRKHLCDVDSSWESVNESSQADEKLPVKQHGQKQESCPHPYLSLKEEDSSICESILCESTGILIDPKKPMGLQLVQAHIVHSTGAHADLTDAGRVQNDSIVMVSNSELTSGDVSNNGKTVMNCVENKFVTADLYSAAGEVVPLLDTPFSNQNVSLQSSVSACDKSDQKVIDSQEQFQSDDTLKDNNFEKIMVISQEQKSLISEKTEVTANVESALKHPVPSSTGITPIRFSDKSCNFDNMIQTSGVEVPLPTGPDPARWYMLNIANRFDLLHLAHSKCIIRYAQLIRAVYLANSHGKTVRVPLQKTPSKENHSKNSHMSHDEKQTRGTTQPKFGVYTVPNLYTRVFIGPYGLREEAGVGAIKIVNGKLVNTMYADAECDSSADADEGVTSLLGSGGKEAILNKKMEELYDSVALAQKNSRVCRGMWLYTARLEDKTNTAGNVKASVVSLDGNRVSSESTNSSTSAPITGMSEGKSNFAVDGNKLYTELQGKKFHAEMEDSKSCGENESAAQYSLTDDAGIESRRAGSRRKQTLEVKNDTSVTISCHKTAVHKTSRDTDQEFVEEEGEEKGSSHLIITESHSSTTDALSSMKSDSDEETLDVETPCDTGILFRKTHLLLKKKAVCRRTRRNKNSLQKWQKQVVPESKDDEVSSVSTSSTASVNSVVSVAKDMFKAPMHAGTLFPQGSPVMSVGKTAVSIKLVPSIPSVGYIRAVMYHNKSVMLRDPFSPLDEQAFFQNLETATSWLTDELKKKVEFIPQHLTLLWRIKHATVNTKICQPFDHKILDGNYFLTEKGVFERKARNTLAHANNEKVRRHEMLDCFHTLGSTFLSEEELRKTNRYNILKLAINEIKNVNLINMRLVSEREILRKRRITNFESFYEKLKALPFIEDRKREVDRLKEVFENYDEQIPVVINLDETVSDVDGSVTTSARKAKDSAHHAQNALFTHTCDRESRNESNPNNYLAEENDEGDSTINRKIVNNENPLIPHPLQLKEGMDDDSVSVSISVVRDDDPVPFVSESEDKDVVTVTRIPRGSVEDKPLQDRVERTHKSFINKAEGVIQSEFSASGKQRKSEKITTIVDTLQALPLKANTDTSERQDSHTVKMDEILGFPSKSEKEVNDISPENLGTVSLSKKLSDESIGFLRFPTVQEKNKSQDVARKAVLEDIVLEEPEKLSVESLDVKDTVPNSAKNQSDTDEIDVGDPFPNLGGVCYTLMPTKRKRISISVDSKRIRTSASLGMRSVPNIQDTNLILQNVQKFKLKQQKLGLNSSGNYVLANNINNIEGSPPQKIRLYELNRNLQNNCVKVENTAEKDIIVKNPIIDLPSPVSISKSPCATGTVSVSFPSLKGNILQGQSSDLKYVVYDKSKSRLVSANVPSGNKVGYHVVTSCQVGKNRNAVSFSNVTQNTEIATPLYFAVVSSACANAAGTTSSISASTVKNVAAVEGSNQRTKQVGPQIASSVGYPSGHTVQLLRPVTSRTVCVAGNKLVNVKRRKNSQYMICNGNQLYGCYPILVPAQSPSSVVTNFMNSNSSTNKNSIPLLALPNPNTNLSEGCHPILESSIVKPLQPSEFSTNSVNQTIKIKQLPPGVCAAVIPDKLRRLSCDPVPDTDMHTTTSFPKLTLTTLTTHTNSTASHVLKPDVVNTTQSKPIVSILNSNSHAATVVPKRLESSLSFPAFIPVARKVSSASLENLKKNSTFCFRTAASNIPISKLITADVKSVESESFNLNVASPVSARRLLMVNVMGSSSERSSDIPCSINSVSSGNRIESENTEKVSGKQPVVADTAVTSNSNEEREISQNNGISGVRILDDKSETDISNLETSDEKSQNNSVPCVITSDDSKSQNDISSISSSNEKSQCDISSGRRSNEKLRSDSLYSVGSSTKKRINKSATSLPKQDSPSTPSPKSKSKAQEDSGYTVKHIVRTRSRRNRTKAPVEMMVTRSSSRRKLLLYKLKSCT